MWVIVVLSVVAAFLVVVTIVVAGLAATMFSGAPWVATKRSVSQAMCKLAGITSDDRVMYLGCGDASVLIVAAREFGATCVGVELNPFLVWIARARVRLAGVADRVTIVRGNMFQVPLPDVDVVLLYLLPKATHRVEKRLQERYKHLRVVSHGFQLQQSPTQEVAVGPIHVRRYEW